MATRKNLRQRKFSRARTTPSDMSHKKITQVLLVFCVFAAHIAEIQNALINDSVLSECYSSTENFVNGTFQQELQQQKKRCHTD